MNLAEFGPQVLQGVIATAPGLAILAGSIYTNLKKVKENVATFPQEVNNTKEKISSEFKIAETSIKTSLDSYKEEMQDKLTIMEESLTSKVNGNLEGMKSELSTYQEEMRMAKEQSNMLVKQNKVYMDTISELMAQDPKLIQSGIASKIVTRISSTNEDLSKTPENILMNSKLLEKALFEAKVVLGEVEYKKLLARVDAKEI